MDVDTFNSLDNLINKACIERNLWDEKAAWTEIKADKDKLQVAQQKLIELQKKFEQVNKDAQKLSEPPLQYAVYLGSSPSSEHDLIIGQGYARLEARIKEELFPQLKNLRLGQTVLLNEKQNVVAIRGEYVVGQTAEVVNIIVPEGEAKIQKIIEDTPAQFVVLWRENEEITVACSPTLHPEDMKVGDYVQIDAEGKVALPREKPRLHVKASGNEGTVVEISDHLYTQGVKIGDIVRIEPNLKFAFERLPAYETGELTLEEVPDVTYDDIGGLDNQIEQIYDAIELPYLYRETFERYQLSRPKGILLYGPPGCGKTMVAKAVANNLTRNIRWHLKTLEQYILLYQQLDQQPHDAQLVEQVDRLSPPTESEITTSLDRLALFLRQYDIHVEHLDDKLVEIRSVLAKKDGVRSFFLNVKGPELLDKYVGETEHRIRKIFEIARSHATYYTPVIIFFDEMEAMFRTRGSGRSSDIETTIVPQFLSELDGVETSANLVIIGASNRQDMIDPAILRPKRLDIKVKVDRPDRKAARDIFSMYLLPTLPLSTTDGSPATKHTEPPTCVFRTAYPAYYPLDDRGVQPGKRKADTDTAGLLPVGCDFRLALSLLPEELDNLAQLPPKSTVRDALALEQQENLPWSKLRRFKLELEIAEVVHSLRKFYERRAQDTTFYHRVEHFVHMEWIAETLLLRANDLLYSPSSMLTVLTTKGINYGLPLKDFMSGAIIANIVDRAKRQAVKRRMIGQKVLQEGITSHDLQQAIEQEFNENKEQLAQHKLRTEWGKLDEDIQSVQIFLQEGESDPWSETKLPMYSASFTSSAVR